MGTGNAERWFAPSEASVKTFRFLYPRKRDSDQLPPFFLSLLFETKQEHRLHDRQMAFTGRSIELDEVRPQ